VNAEPASVMASSPGPVLAGLLDARPLRLLEEGPAHPHPHQRSCPWCHYGGCNPSDDEIMPGTGPCSIAFCGCVCRMAPWPKPAPGQRGYGAVISPGPA